MNYTFHQLRIFLKVVQTESITRAAEQLYMTQPAASIQLRKFQDQFEVPLTEVHGRKLFITQFGKEIASIAERILHDADTLEFKTRAYKGMLSGRLRIASASTGKYVIPYFLNGFLNQHYGIDLVLDVTNKSRVINSLNNNEIDLALVSVVPDNLIVQEEKLMENKLFLVSSQPTLSKDGLLLFREKGSATRKAMEDFLHGTDSPPMRKRVSLTSNEAVKQAVVAGLGASIIPLIGMKNELQNRDLYILDTPGLPIRTDWRLIWLAERKLPPVAEAFLEFVRKEKSAILERHFTWYLEY